MDHSRLIQDINNTLNTSPGDVTPKDRAALMEACDKLKKHLESPMEATMRLAFGGMEATLLRLGIDMKVFDTVATGDKKEVSVEQLASPTSADPVLTNRIARFLAATGFLKEIGHETYTATDVSANYVSHSPLAAFIIHIEVISRLPSYFELHGYKNPVDGFNGPFQYARNTELQSFDWLSRNPKYQQAFNITMNRFHKFRSQEWFDYYPTTDRLHVADPLRALIVDIGGGLGQELIKFRDAYPQLQGRLIIEDLPNVIDDIKELPKGIEALGQDFLKEQQVKGAKSYYLRDILHDWPAKQALGILAHIKDAMADDSILLINENVLLEQGVSAFSAASDIIMMSEYASMERTEKQFRGLVADAGLRVVNVWTPGEAATGPGTLFEVMQ